MTIHHKNNDEIRESKISRTKRGKKSNNKIANMKRKTKNENKINKKKGWQKINREKTKKGIIE